MLFSYMKHRLYCPLTACQHAMANTLRPVYIMSKILRSCEKLSELKCGKSWYQKNTAIFIWS